MVEGQYPTDARDQGSGERPGPDPWRPARVPLIALCLAACAPTLALDPPGSPGTVTAGFQVGRDTFAFPNLVRAEHPERTVDFANYCIIMSRGATQFFRFARFEPDAPPVSDAEYTRLTRQVMAIGAWEPPRAAGERIVIPGYPDLYAFSREREAALKAAFDWNRLSMAHWRTWRVALPLPADHQPRLAVELRQEIDAGRPAPLMISNFPHPDALNHAVLVYGYRTGAAATVEFLAYDPNDPGTPLGIHYDPGTTGFWLEPTPYSPPGRIRAFRLFSSPLL
jgi:hypothetical protein